MISRGCDSTCSRWSAVSSNGLVSNRIESSGLPAPVDAFRDERRVGAGWLLARPVISNRVSCDVILTWRKGQGTNYFLGTILYITNYSLFVSHWLVTKHLLNSYNIIQYIRIKQREGQTWWLVLQASVWGWTWDLLQSAWWSHLCPCCL